MAYLEEAGTNGKLVPRPPGTAGAGSDSAVQRPVYYTKSLNRKVYGGGGIAPDFTLKPDTLSALERRLIRDNVLFDFASHYAGTHRAELNDLGSFISGFELSKKDLAEIKKIIEDKGVAVQEEEFQASLDFIRRVVMQEIALARWDREAQLQVLASLDPEVHQALNLFDQAEQLVADRNGGIAPGAASRRGRAGEEVGRIR
jgi:carboxyl-terminal processing protease